MDINKIYGFIRKMYDENKSFDLENDIQRNLANIIFREYQNDNVMVFMEAIPVIDKIIDIMEIDILVILDYKVIPIELKYKKKCQKGATDGRRQYYHDIERIKILKDIYAKDEMFLKGYTIFFTDDINYIKYPQKNIQNVKYPLNDTNMFKWKVYSHDDINYNIDNKYKEGTLFYIVNEI